MAEDRLAAIKETLNKRECNNISFCYSGNNTVLLENNVFAAYMKSYRQTFFFEKPVTDWDTLRVMLALDVSDIYIAERMGFELDDVKELTEKFNCQIRTYIDVCQASTSAIDPLYAFWIRPEDIDFYSQYIDVIERYREGDAVQNDTYYEIFMIEKKWNGDLGEIINGLENYGLDSRCFINSWRRRATCEKRCLKGSPCRVCPYIKRLVEDLRKDEMTIVSN